MAINSKSKSLEARPQETATEAEGIKSRAAKKREEETSRRAEAAAKKAEARQLAIQEEEELSRIMLEFKRESWGEYLQRQRDEEVALQRLAEKAKKKAKKAEMDKKRGIRIAEDKEYARVVNVVNTNRDDSVIEAKTLEGAIAQVKHPLPADKHPEKSLKISFKAFKEAELLKLMEEKPDSTLDEYNDMILKLWKKSPDNPLSYVTNLFKLDKGFDSYEILKSELDEYGHIITSSNCSQASDLGENLDEGELTVTPPNATLMDFIQFLPHKDRNQRKAIS